MSGRFVYNGENEFFSRLPVYPEGGRPYPGFIYPEFLGNIIFGGYEIGETGVEGSVYEGFTLSWADNFEKLDIVGPNTPKARFFPTAGYGAGIRGNLTSRGSAQDTDPLWTGYNDVNRGLPASINNMMVSGSWLHLMARKATPQEQSYFTPTDTGINGGVRPQVSATIHAAGAIAWYPTTNAVIIDFRAAFSSKTTNPAGWHPALWFFTTMLRAATGNELDLEGNSQNLFFETIDHTNGTVTTTQSKGGFDFFDGVARVYTIVMRNGGNIEFWVDGVLRSTIAGDANTKSLPMTALLSSHITNNTFNGDTYSQAVWDSSATGAEIAIDYMRVWRTTGVEHWRPLVAVADLNVSYAGTGSVVLPSAKDIWGDASVIEEVQVVPYDAAEPGMATQTIYTTNLPTGVSYNSSTRTISVDFSVGTGNAGRMHFVVYGYKQDGSTMEPLRFCVNRGPKVTAASLQPGIDGNGNPFVDLYFTADVGKIFPKQYSVVAPAGWTYDPNTFRLTASPGAVGGNVTVTVVNGVGQADSATINMWSPALFGSSLTFAWDTTDAVSMPSDGSSKVQTLNHIYGGKSIAQSTAANRPIIATNGGGDGTRRFMSFLSNSISMRSDDAGASNASSITHFADTANDETNNLYVAFAAKESAISTVNRVLGWFKADGSQFLAFRYTTSGRGAQTQGSGGTAQSADQALQDTNWHVFEIIKTGATLAVKCDGVQVATVTITQAGGVTADLFILGGAQSGGAFTGGIGPGLFVNTVPSSSDQTSARQWIATKMGIATS